LEIHLRTPEQQRPVTGVVSAQQLRNEIPKKALREFRRAQEAVEKGKIQRAIEHLRKAIQIHPAFAEAHNSLGVKFMMLGDYGRAAAAFEEAVRLRPATSEPLGNLGIALHGVNRFDEAERLIRRSLELQPEAVKSRFALALVLSSRAKLDEAFALLAEVADRIPEAHFHAARLLEQRADPRGAAREMRAYLDSGDSKHRQVAERWLQNWQSRAAGLGYPGID
jgi:Flp pilus assembly protein TadD